MANVGDLNLAPVSSPLTVNAAGVQVALNGSAILACCATFGTAGAVDSSVGDVGITITKPTGTGLYRITVPGSKALYLVGNPAYIDAAGHVNTKVCPKSKDASTGVIDVTVAKETASANTVFQAANADSGDSMDVVVLAEW